MFRTTQQKLSSLTDPQVHIPGTNIPWLRHKATYLAAYPVVVRPGPPAVQSNVHVAELTLQALQLLLYSASGQVQPACNAAPRPAGHAPGQMYSTTSMQNWPGQVLR